VRLIRISSKFKRIAKDCGKANELEKKLARELQTERNRVAGLTGDRN